MIDIPLRRAKSSEHLRRDIPEKFYRTFEKRVFDSCDFCYRPLRTNNTQYFIIKHYMHQELHQELALCLDCRRDTKRYLSMDLTNDLNNSVTNALTKAHVQHASTIAADSAEHRTASCVLCSVRKNTIDAYIEYAYLEGDQMVYHLYPFMVCDACLRRTFESLANPMKALRLQDYSKRFISPPLPGHGDNNIDHMIFEML